MKISDEMREWCKWCAERSAARDSLCKLADRVDREMVELPKDADGVPIHVGDIVFGYASGIELIVNGMRLTDSWAVSTNHGLIPRTSEVAHERPDSLERIADDLEKWLDAPSADWDDFKEARNLVDRIRKLAKEDENAN